MAVEAVEENEFTLDEILAMHQGWITHLFSHCKKSEIEIVQLLYERHFIVT